MIPQKMITSTSFLYEFEHDRNRENFEELVDIVYYKEDKDKMNKDYVLGPGDEFI